MNRIERTRKQSLRRYTVQLENGRTIRTRAHLHASKVQLLTVDRHGKPRVRTLRGVTSIKAT